MIIRIVRFIISILLLPACVAITENFYKGILSIKTISEVGFLFILGALSYAILHLILFKLDFLYVLGHEVMHAITALFSGGKVKEMKVSAKGGSVKTTRSNFLVALAPYLCPSYTVFMAIVYFSLSFFMDVTKYSPHFIFLIGFTLMFHLAYTAESMRQKQSDLVETGYLFSISSIYIVNLAIVFAIISLLFKDASFLDFLSGTYEKTKLFYYSFWKQLFL